jgi:Flp pilus assembly protein protease CpaA
MDEMFITAVIVAFLLGYAAGVMGGGTWPLN